MRRSSDSGLPIDYYGSSSYDNFTSLPRQKTSRKHRKPRSWHPSPYVSDEDDDQYNREAKKEKIKMEISRRRSQIQENSKLHEELLRLARLRESAENGGYASRYDSRPLDTYTGTGLEAGTSVLRSIDEILREETYGRRRDCRYGLSYEPYSAQSALFPERDLTGRGGVSPNHYISEEDRSMARLASTFQGSDTYGRHHMYDRFNDYSPNSENLDFTPSAMPLLPDMPSRSRKLLEDLGSYPLHGKTGKYSSSYRPRRK